MQIQRPAGFRSGARQPFAAERLHPDHRADHVAVHIQIADPRARNDLLDRLVDARMHAQRQAVARGVDLRQQRIEFVALVAQHVQHRPEDLARQLVHVRNLDQRRRNEGAERCIVRHRALRRMTARDLEHATPFRAHGVDVAFERRLRLAVDHRADVDAQMLGIAHRAFGHRALQHLDGPLCDVRLHAQHPQRRAALTGAVESRGDDVVDDLLHQRGRVDHHRVLPAGFCDQRHRMAEGVEPPGDRALEDARHLRRAGEEHALHPRIGHQRSTDGVAGTRQQLQNAGRQAGRVEDFDRLRRNQRRLFGRLGQHGVAGSQRCGDLADEDRQREIPRADADDRPKRTVRVVAEACTYLRRVVAQEIHRLAHFGDGVRQRLPGFAHQQAEQRLHAAFEQIGGAVEHVGAVAGRRRLPDLEGVLCGGQSAFYVGGVSVADVADDVVVTRRIADRLARNRREVGGRLSGPGQHRLRGPRFGGTVQQCARQ